MVDSHQDKKLELESSNSSQLSQNETDHRMIAFAIYNSERDDEIDIEENDIISVLERRYSKWWHGRNERTGQTGLFPSKNVRPLNSDHNNGNNNLALERTISTETLSNTDMIEWTPSNEHCTQNAKDVNGNIHFDSSNSNSQEFTLQMDSNTHNEEHKSQTRIYIIKELIETEDKYLNEMNFTLQNISDLIQKSCLMSIEETNDIFGHLRKIYEINLAFNEHFKNLQVQNKLFESSIGLTLVDYLERMLPIYEQYCSSKVAELLSKIDENEQIGREDKFTYKFGLDSPMRRIPRYRLLIENLLKNTLKTHSDYEDCERALKSAKKLCQKINKIYDKMCQQLEPFQNFQWIQRHVLISSNQLDQTIEFNSDTQFLGLVTNFELILMVTLLGNRILLHSGILLSDSKMLFAFLFNDFLLLAKPNEPPLNILEDSTTIINIFKNADTRHLKCILHEKPFLLNDIQVADLDEFETSLNSNLFRLEIKSMKKHISLQANSMQEWDNWIQQINHAKYNYIKTEQMFRDIDKGQIGAPLQKPIAILTLASVEALQLYGQNYALNAYCKVAMGKNWSQAYSITTSDTVRRVMKSQKPQANFGRGQSIRKSFLSKLKIGITKNITSTANNDTNEDNQQLIWQLNSYFNVHHCKDNLFVRCYDANPFAPHQFMGETKLPISKILQQNRFTNESQAAWIYMDMENEQQSENYLKSQEQNIRPNLKITFGLAICTDVNSIKRLYDLQ